jgi:hypothetical protein
MGQYDSARRRPAVRKGRERGVWVYVPLVELLAAGIDPEPVPFYRIWTRPKKRSVQIQFYADE